MLNDKFCPSHAFDGFYRIEKEELAMVKKAKVIFHVDMNSFYASVEMAFNPKLKGKPIAIAGNPHERRGIIVTSSYEARAKGVQTTMPLWQARKLCPNLTVIRPDFAKYKDTSTKIFKILAEMSPIIEPVSIDECYIDVTDHPTHPITLANEMQQRLLKELDIPCSIGIGPNKFLAKTASDFKKPLGITILRIRDLPEKLWPLSIDKMHGVGSKTSEKLNQINIFTIKNLALADIYSVTQLLGINGERLINRANGIDNRIVDPDSVNDFKSIGNSQTLREDTIDETKINSTLNHLASRVEERLQRRELKGMTVQLMMRYADRTTVTRSRKLMSYIDDKESIMTIIQELFQEHWDHEPIRLLGITVQDLLEKSDIMEQLNLFTYEQEEKRAFMIDAVQSIQDKYGEDIFIKQPEKELRETDDKMLRTSFQKDFLDDYRQ